jgi:hypothetical protein
VTGALVPDSPDENCHCTATVNCPTGGVYGTLSVPDTGTPFWPATTENGVAFPLTSTLPLSVVPWVLS